MQGFILTAANLTWCTAIKVEKISKSQTCKMLSMLLSMLCYQTKGTINLNTNTKDGIEGSSIFLPKHI